MEVCHKNNNQAKDKHKLKKFRVKFENFHIDLYKLSPPEKLP